MRILLIAATIAFISAGVYGALDVTRDIKNGTFIQYEDEDAVFVNQFGGKHTKVFTKNSLQVADKKEEKADKKTSLSLNEIDFSTFSRGEPPMFYESLLLEKVGAPDSVKSADVLAAINDTIAAINEKAKEVSKKDSVAIAKKEERKFSLKLYSRGRPRPLIKETVAVQADSTKK